MKDGILVYGFERLDGTYGFEIWDLRFGKLGFDLRFGKVGPTVWKDVAHGLQFKKLEPTVLDET